MAEDKPKKQEEIEKRIEEAKKAESSDSSKKDFKNKPKAEDKGKDEPVAVKSKEEEYLELSKRIQADFENYRKRQDRETESYRKYAAAEFAKKMLPVLDSFELAIKNSTDAEKFKKGIELIYAQFYSVLEEMGVRKIECLHQKFDPYKHEVLMTDSCSKCEDNIIVEEFQKGYMFHDQVLRYSKVKIAKKESKDEKCK